MPQSRRIKIKNNTSSGGLKSFRLHRPICPECGTPNARLLYSPRNLTVILLSILLPLEIGIYRKCRHCRHVWFNNDRLP